MSLKVICLLTFICSFADGNFFPKSISLETEGCSEVVNSGTNLNRYLIVASSYMNYLLEIGEWTPWSPWTTCSASCGFGIKNTTRNCEKPNEVARDCPIGETVKSEPCYLQPCQGICSTVYVSL